MFRITVYDVNPAIEPEVFLQESAPRLSEGTLHLEGFAFGDGDMTEEDFDFVEV